jgi:uncharacterized protein (DUF1501 family)
MEHAMTLDRRHFLKRTSALASLSSLGLINAHAQPAPDYKALVCIFMFGGNDGHNLIVPTGPAAYSAYKTIRGGLSLPDNNTTLLPVTARDGTPYGLNSGLSAIHPLWAQQKLAVVANVGMLVRPTTRAQYLAASVPLPSNLFSHSDQTVQMQAGNPAGGGTGWAGRIADASQASNSASSFPPSISVSGSALFCAGKSVQSASLVPGFDLSADGMSSWPASATAARVKGLQDMLGFDNGMVMVQSANKVRTDALSLNALLKGLAGGGLNTVFPATSLGSQLKQVAQIIKLRASTNMKRQVFFCSIGGFDTHSGQSWQQWDLLRQIAEAASAFYASTVELGVANSVTTFTSSEFGRTLQPSGTGSDHGWGNHHLLLGGAVRGGDVIGSFPAPALGGADDSGGRGALIPSTSLDQFGATLASWFGVAAVDLPTVFPNLPNFPVANLGFMG